MTDRLRISGTPVITEDESTGDVTVDVDETSTGILSVGGDAQIVEDANSPFTTTDDGNATYTLSGEYDQVLVVFETLKRVSGGTTLTDLLVEGVSGSGYDYIDSDGSAITGASGWRLVNPTAIGDELMGQLIISARWDTGAMVAAQLSATNALTTVLTHGKNESVSSPLTEFAIQSGNTTHGNEIHARVYGVTL